MESVPSVFVSRAQSDQVDDTEMTLEKRCACFAPDVPR